MFEVLGRIEENTAWAFGARSVLPQHKREATLPSQTETKMSFARSVADVEREGACTSVPCGSAHEPLARDLNVSSSVRNPSSEFAIL